jgi:hypothetical protein
MSTKSLVTSTKLSVTGIKPKRYTDGLSKRKTVAKLKNIATAEAIGWNNPRAYEIRTNFEKQFADMSQQSTYTTRFHKKYGDGKEIKTPTRYRDQPLKAKLWKIAQQSGIAYIILKKVFNRGRAAFISGSRPGQTAESWGFARVYSFCLEGKTWSTADADLAEDVRASKK